MGFNDFVKMFDFEEKMFLNNNALGASKGEFLNQCSFSCQVVDDELCSLLVKRVMEKVELLTEEEWEELKQYIPFEVPVSDADVDDVE